MIEVPVPKPGHVAAIAAFLFLSSVALAASVQGHPMLVALKADPDGGVASAILVRIFWAGLAVHAFNVLRRLKPTTRVTPLQVAIWLGEVGIGGFVAYLTGGAYYSYGPAVTPLQMTLAGLVGGFIGAQLIFLAFWAAGRKFGFTITPKDLGEGGGDGGA